ncbi:homeoprotein [Verticillium alfalfae VaMs.102]|uniref:Homeoprotein n=1 Tax=Verticillium alfalfae (strain VaMs.102 / ATCC MYA-4576 / FGSC 10136) TaxID=526221 RepID=C9SNQ9_VERA1|nr:homeoprotein [Verticillium alfalfae VaMs.102]EEY20424.1 homeoprotein [Verticillium alfalfae VaMs.102]
MAAVDIGTPVKREPSALADSPACPTPLSQSLDNHGTPGSASNVKMNSTPSPSTSTASNGQPSQSRRPPRKSTLTQQQKNQKRQRATQDQLGTLEMEFNKNPTPTAQVRDRIAEEIDMTERSVQIWFQNRHEAGKGLGGHTLAGYKIEYPFAYIKNMYLENQEGDPSKPSGIVIELNRPPHFFMDQTPATSGFFQCGDFTEEQQASNCLVHHLGGNPKVLSGQLAKLVSLDAFMNRNNPNPFFENHSLSVSAPVSPTARPSSQPNFAQPHVGMFQESWGINHLQPGMRGPGHKRQRSRSVPMAVDFSMLQTPMPSFYIQQPGEAAPQPHNPNIFAPVPQQPSGLGPNLRIDTQAGFGMEMRQYPMSATTASPSEFASPGYFAGPEPSPLPTSSYNTPYGGAFLSPMANPSNMVPPPHSPLSFNGHGEPSIVEQSPPLSMLGRAGVC